MPRSLAIALGVFLLLSTGNSPSRACSLCAATATAPTLREDSVTAKLVVFGTLSNPRVDAAAPGGAADGSATDLAVERILKGASVLAGKKKLTLPRYVPVDPKSPPKFLVFCDVVNGKLDPIRGCPASAALVEYLAGAAALPVNDPVKQYSYFGRFLDHADSEVAADAFREFARAGDADIAAAAKYLDPARLRTLLTDSRTPPERLTLFAYLLGGCGTAADADLLARLLRQPDERLGRALGGMLAGYTQLRPDDGWRLLFNVLADPQQPFPHKLAALGTVRFFFRSQPATHPRAIQALAILLPQGDFCDLAVEDLRAWREWGLTTEVLAQYGKKSHGAPMVRRAIIRYALCCPRPEATHFVEQVRRTDAALLREVEESLEFEKPAPSSR